MNLLKRVKNRFNEKVPNKVGLALGVGAAQGLAHIGVIKGLREKNIQVEAIGGTSAGALIGACYAVNGDIEEVEQFFCDVDWEKITQLIDFKPMHLNKGLLEGDKVKKFLDPLLGEVAFQDLKIPLAVIATDINTGEEVIIKKGSVFEAVRASISMPILFMPTKIEDKWLTDGGSVNPIPVEVVRKMGSDFVVASNIVPSPMQRDTSLNNREQSKRQSFLNKLITTIGIDRGLDEEMPDMLSVLFQAMYASEHVVVKEKIKNADLVITPETQNIATLDFTRAEEAIEKGYQALINTLEEK